MKEIEKCAMCKRKIKLLHRIQIAFFCRTSTYWVCKDCRNLVYEYIRGYKRK